MQSQHFFKMGDRAKIDLFHKALNYWNGNARFTQHHIERKAVQGLKLLVVEKKDVLAVLQTGFGKTLIYQLLPPVCNFMINRGRSNTKNSSVLVILPLNVLI